MMIRCVSLVLLHFISHATLLVNAASSLSNVLPLKAKSPDTEPDALPKDAAGEKKVFASHQFALAPSEEIRTVRVSKLTMLSKRHMVLNSAVLH